MHAVLPLLLLMQPQLPPNHPPLSSKPAPSAAALLQKLDATEGLEAREKSFEVAASLGHLYFSQGRYAKAKTYYAQAVAKAAEVHALYTKLRAQLGHKPRPSPNDTGPNDTGPNDTGPNDTGCGGLEAPQAQRLERGKQHLASGKTAQAMACLRPAMAALTKVQTSLGHVQFLSGEVDAALASYTRAIQGHEDNLQAHYARGALLLDAKADESAALHEAQADLKYALQQAPGAAWAAQARRLLKHAESLIAEGGLTASLPPQGKAPKPARQAPAAQLLNQAEAYLAKGAFQKALAQYKQLMPLQPGNPRLRAGMAWTMVRLQRQPMADRVWRVAAENPKALATLGDTLHAKGDEAGAQALWLRLKRTVPSYAAQLESRLAAPRR